MSAPQAVPRRRSAADARRGRSGPRHHARTRAPARVPRTARIACGRPGSRALPSVVVARLGLVGPFVDCHSHVIPSGDDGAASVQEGLALCRSAAEHGTAVLFGTPHVWPYFTLSAEREVEIREVYQRMRPHAGLELRLGFELTPTR